MKIVLRHRVTGRYYSAPGKWVRRADNALSFDHVDAAREFSESHHLKSAQPVRRLAPYVMGLLQGPSAPLWAMIGMQRAPVWDFQRRARFFRN